MRRSEFRKLTERVTRNLFERCTFNPDVNCACAVLFRVDDDRTRACISSMRRGGGETQKAKCQTEPSPLFAVIDREPAKKGRTRCRITDNHLFLRLPVAVSASHSCSVWFWRRGRRLYCHLHRPPPSPRRGSLVGAVRRATNPSVRRSPATSGCATQTSAGVARCAPSWRAIDAGDGETPGEAATSPVCTAPTVRGAY